MDPTDRWHRVLATPETLRLAEAAALIAARRDPARDPDATLAHLDGIAAGCPGRSLDALRVHLFDTLGFGGDGDHYHHERNSLLPDVLERRRGLPILLSIVTIDVGHQVGVALEPVGMPGHFLVRCRDEPDTFLDPFHGGAVVDQDGCERLFRRSNGPSVPFDATVLDPVPPLAVVARLLANLKGTYAAANDRANLLWVLELRMSLPSVPRTEAFDLAAVLAGLGRFDDAADVLDRLAAADVGAASSEASTRALRLRARLN